MVFMFLGKGGVGKTTMACSIAWSLAEDDSVFVFSVDPAHNLFHFFQKPSSKEVELIKKGLYIEEIDIEQYVKKFLEEVSQNMKDTYKYLQILNLENMFDLLKFSPGLQEWAVLKAMSDRITHWSQKVSHIVIDAPPTGLALRLLSLPFTGELWIEKLLRLRKKILSRREEIIRIKGHQEGPAFYSSEDKDPVTVVLKEEYQQLKALRSLLLDSNTMKPCLVLNYDELSIQEGLNILDALGIFKIKPALIIVNKVQKSQKPPLIDEFLNKTSDIKTVEIPYFMDQFTPRKAIKTIGDSILKAIIDEY